MVFSGISEVFSSITNRFSSPKPSLIPHSSSELPPTARGSIFSNSRHKNNLRLSSSLQDFSAYSRLDPEEGNLNLDRSSTNANHLHFSTENNTTSFSKEKTPPPRRRKCLRVVTTLLCLLLFTFIIYSLLHLYSNSSKKSARFFVVLDCGSTGTRVYVYKASTNHQKDENLPILLKSIPEDHLHDKPSSQSGRAYNRKETEPGFDKLVHNVTGLTQAIIPLLKWAEKQIPEHSHKTTSLFLYATAGVRRLPSSDSTWLLNNAWQIMKKSSFLCRREWVKIISGTEEAYFGWIALNYHTHMLGVKAKKETYGALDLGGSSLQVTFESHDYANNETSLNLSIGPVNHRLIAYSLSGFGLNDAFDKSVVRLLKTNLEATKMSKTDLVNGKAVVKHPCLQSGYKEEYTCSHCQLVFPDDKSQNKIRVQLIGAPNWEECNALAKLTVNSSGVNCDSHPCALQDNFPIPHGNFYAMSGFFVVYRFFNLSGDATLDEVLQKGQQFCEKTWDLAKISVPPQPFIEQYCFRAPYIVLLLRKGLHIKDSEVNIGSGGITWTTGVALLEAGKVISTNLGVYDYKLVEISVHPFALSAIWLVSLCLLVYALSCVGKCLPRFFRRLNLPLFRHRNASGNSGLNIPSPFKNRRWSPIISGEGRIKTPLSPVARVENRPFGTDIQLAESSLYPSSRSIPHSISSSSLGQMQFDTSSGFYPSPHRGNMRLQSRRSQSREDLVSSLSDTHLPKV